MTTTIKEKSAWAYLLSAPVIVASLGYFVDIYDLLLFGIVRIPSLTELGLDEAARSVEGASILNWQMTGLLLGGILWGVLGDKKGRLSVLFGSIITYSIANFACGFVQDVFVYKILRFIAGIGLAGELGAGITLVSESLPKKLRALGTSLVAGVGLLGAVVGYFTVELFSWRNAYFIGGGMGIMLLFLRIGVFESGMFHTMKAKQQLSKGNFLSFFTKKSRLILYLKCIGVGLPTWFVIGILATFSNEIGKALQITEAIKPGLAVMWCYVGLAAGDLVSGVISYWLESRRKAVAYLMIFAAIGSLIFLYGGISTTKGLYAMCLWVGFGIGYWAMFVTIGAEQFGTNVRATAATTIPNMVRGTVVLMTTGYTFLKPHVMELNAAAIIGVICFGIGFYSIKTIPETHHKDLDFVED
ncbi:MFS transporter [Pedobacter gandavensis]|uniref:MFS transporter n=1 Tax=Pedobacter gandavensis TaxID=2679963 RepID=UPI00292FDC02|nr:MFS transporter [Pedobacter gandavensis]